MESNKFNSEVSELRIGNPDY